MNYVSLPSFYLSAPTSPTLCSPENPRFYSAWSTPGQPFGSGSGVENTNNDEFEFETTSHGLVNPWDHDDRKYRLPARANSFSTISFADEIFCNGELLPLKPPPRLQKSVPTSPRSYGSRVRHPFAKRSTWNDGFDPFMIALEKVSEEPEGRISVHRRSRSYSPFRVDCSVDRDHGQQKEPTMVDRRGQSQTMVKKRTESSMQHDPTARTMMRRLWLGHNEPVKPKPCRESKMQKVKSVLSRYASLKKETGESKQSRELITISKISYFKRLSLSLKTHMRKKESVESKMVIVKHDMKLPRCLGYYGPPSPRWL